MSTMVIEPVRQGVTVPLGLDEAWRLFTEETATWWPLTTRSVYQQEARDVQIRARCGRRDVRDLGDRGAGALGARARVGAAAAARARLAGQPGHAGADRARGHVRAGRRRHASGVEHRALERLGEDGRAARDMYAGGWQEVLEAFADATGRKETT